MNYENFISYKRSQSSAETKMIYDALTQRGLTTFCDIYELGSCKYSIKLLEIIRECTNFILIVSDNLFENIFDKEDWIYKELSTAIESKKNIICIFLSESYKFPENLPTNIVEIQKYNGLYFSKHYFDSFISKLVKQFVVSKDEISVSNENSDFIIENNILQKYVGVSKIVYIPDDVSIIGEYAFKDCTFIEKVVFSNKINRICEHAFERCLNITTLLFNDELKIIEKNAFSRCFNLNYVKLNDKLEVISDYCFSYCNKLKYIKISKNVKSISSSAFNNCPKLEAIIVDKDNNFYCDIDGLLYKKDLTYLIRCPEGFNSINICIDNHTICLEEFSFYKCIFLQNISLNNVKIIKSHTFSYCVNISQLFLPDSVTDFSLEALEGWTNIQQIRCSKNFNQALKYKIDNLLKPDDSRDAIKNNDDFILIKTAFESYEEAEYLCRMLLDRHYIVSGQITKIHSIYNWNNSIDSEDEYELTCFSMKSLFPIVSDFIKENHSYEVCELIAIQITDTTDEFGDWIKNYVSQ